MLCDLWKDVGLVVIGRNEGERLRLCLQSLPKGAAGVYVDSGSTDGSPQMAAAYGLQVIELEIPPNFTAARARNVGIVTLLEMHPGLTFVQMIDGDCELAPDWMATAKAELLSDTQLAAVFGRRRERFPGASVYNMVCDDEWDVPLGEARSCGGDAMFRLDALASAKGYTDAMIAGEEPDLCLRMRGKGWRIRRVAAEMTLHDAAIYNYAQWWNRARRAGHAFAELLQRHRSHSDPNWLRQIVSMFSWSGVAVAACLAVSAGTLTKNAPTFAIGLGFWALFSSQILRLTIRQRGNGMDFYHAFCWAILIMTGKFAQTKGALEYLFDIITQRNSAIIEYKHIKKITRA